MNSVAVFLLIPWLVVAVIGVYFGIRPRLRQLKKVGMFIQ